MAKRSALLSAAKRGEVSKIRALLEAGEEDLSAKNAKGWGAVALARMSGIDEAIALVVEAGCPFEPVELFHCCAQGYPKAVAALLEHPAQEGTRQGPEEGGEVGGHLPALDTAAQPLVERRAGHGRRRQDGEVDGRPEGVVVVVEVRQPRQVVVILVLGAHRPGPSP